MNISRGHQAATPRAQATRLHMSVLKLPTTIRQSLINPHPTSGSNTRNLWWWSRRHDWSMDEDVEERFLRHQKLMRNRYSKLLRRRSIWEGDEHSTSPVWARSRRWLVTRWADKKVLSYQRALQTGMQDPGKRSDNERPWKEWDRDFEKLKARIDEQVDRDPYGALFGRHLRGPPSPNNSSWTSFSWIYGPLRSMQKDISNMSPDGMPDAATTPAPASKPGQRTTFSVPLRTSGSTSSSQTSPTEQEYEYDPISRRKVPKEKETFTRPPSSTPPASDPPPSKKAFIDHLFSEHGVDIPVKTFKPHKVYGHIGSEAVAAKSSQTTVTSKPKPSGITIESSRLRDLQALKFRTLGNSIDTTAEYAGKYKNPADPEPIHITAANVEPSVEKPEAGSKKHDVENISGEDNGALFAGTTYEAKAKAIASTCAPKPSFKTSWLEKEGFKILPHTLNTSDVATNKPTIAIKADSSSESVKIEPALDRVKAFDVKLRKKPEVATRRETLFLNDKAEDVDLLRASDVRAATRSARMTKQEIELGKEETRKRLETDYSKHQLNGAARFAIKAESTRDSVSKRLSNVWEHVKQYPQGIVAKTINGMGIFNDNYKTYVRFDKPTLDPTEKLVFKDESLSKTPSIYKNVGKRSEKPLHTFTPSQEVVDMERAEKARLAFVRQVNEDSKKKASSESKQAEALASEIRIVYEEQYGKVDVNHRQATAMTDSAKTMSEPASQRTAVTDFQKPAAALQPMGPATVKPGVKEDLVIQDHVSVFEPKLAKIVDEAKSARKAIHEAKLEVMAMRSRRPQTVWSGRSTDAAAISMPKSEPTRIEPALDRSTEKQPPETTRESIEPGSASKYTSEYVVLAYDPLSKIVTTSPLDSSMPSIQDSARKTSVPQILASLNHTSKFLSHFGGLSNQGYEVVSGGGDVLVFKKRVTEVEEPSKLPLLTHFQAVIDKNKLAAQEASAQPAAKSVSVNTAAIPSQQSATSVQSDATFAKEAATVLDEIPTLEPRPGPAGPTAPPMGPPSFMRPKVNRQESVFSASKASRVSSPPSASTQTAWKENVEANASKQDTIWARFKRAVRRVTLTAVAMGAGAYTIGVVAESLGAQQHPEKVIKGRPGIYSTESSR